MPCAWIGQEIQRAQCCIFKACGELCEDFHPYRVQSPWAVSKVSKPALCYSEWWSCREALVRKVRGIVNLWPYRVLKDHGHVEFKGSRCRSPQLEQLPPLPQSALPPTCCLLISVVIQRTLLPRPPFALYFLFIRISEASGSPMGSCQM